MWWPRRWLRARRTGRWIGRTSSHGTKGHWTVAPLPTPRELIGVVGVGSTETVNGNALTLLALERYREADIVTFWFRRPYGGGRSSLFPELDIDVEGAGDAARRVWTMGGSGGGGPEEMTFRHAYAFAPPSGGAPQIVVVVNRIDWIDHRQAQPRVVKSERGPWRFTIRP